jgi:hypothetical protein
MFKVFPIRYFYWKIHEQWNWIFVVENLDRYAMVKISFKSHEKIFKNDHMEEK